MSNLKFSNDNEKIFIDNNSFTDNFAIILSDLKNTIDCPMVKIGTKDQMKRLLIKEKQLYQKFFEYEFYSLEEYSLEKQSHIANNLINYTNPKRLANLMISISKNDKKNIEKILNELLELPL